jgi:VanZ like protein
MWGRAVPAALRRPRLWGVLVVCASVGIIVWITLWPFDFACRESWRRLGHLRLPVGWGKSSVADVLLNALLFIPLGFGLASVLPERRWRTGWTSLVVVLGSCLAVSYVIEVLQQCLPPRYPTWRDVLANSFGGVLGWSGWHSRVWRRQRPSRGDARP